LPQSLLLSAESQLPYARRALLPAEGAARRSSVIGLALAAALHWRYTAQQARRWIFAASGQPFIDGGPAFSISHCRELVACAMTPVGTIGLDVEHVDDVRAEQLRAVLHADERALLRAEDPRSAAELWTAKEAALKASGLGLRELSRVRLQGEHGSVDDRCFARRSVSLPGGYVAALALADTPARIMVIDGGALLREHDASMDSVA
jgi:phosphopantetheinyl transferase